MPKKNVFIIGLDDFNRDKLERLPQAEECEFHAALDISDIRNVDQYDIKHLIDKATRTMEAFDGTVDAITSYYDFPGTVMTPILAERFGLPGPTLESVLKCENKYWSRLEQRKVIPEHIPQFRAFDPFDEEAYGGLGLLPPFWIKPIKSFRSYLAFQINDERQFRAVMPLCREKVGFMGEPFLYLMRHFGAPPEIAEMPESFVAESPIGGWQCTLEGYSYNGRVHIYGVVDSVHEQDSSSFARYEYPSSLPLEIQHRMMDVARMVVQQFGLDNSAFNAEFFYDQTSDQVWFLEINPRVSQAHTDIFEKVHGVSHLSVMVDLALGRKPKPMERKGQFNVAGHFMFRTVESGKVVRVPSAKAIDKLRQRQPGTHVKIPVKPGQHLKDLQGQDMYSFEIANVFIGGRDQTDMLDKYDEALAVLQFDIEKDPDPVIT
ncbi:MULTISPECIES: ATP-grasp domain-containing protein [Ectothiorhodospira]|uniref:ATP-grasp domain-containing protein n=1 Tax=Ectothiorhodospira TaxID=1051 RepID=UPI001EE79890|nr:ATP-grasp domain-containing protein [Ectothiorhodospira variabilis]MCG5505030.1 ATP-grasp domain-containing protein [Ectothiorhodospira variabilis]MCG5508187.1 ATP-grasp domain-containing protein [Ectothiorhodospira variabilis]MCG5525256.1 ATP-grasp domain-containing protein [Ectothiorhodospira haloalkaliphila]